MSTTDGTALGEGLYWMAEKLTWGYEDVEQNLREGLKLYHQAADLGFSDAYIRIGQLQEHGKGTAQDAKAALRSYLEAARAENLVGLAYAAKLLSRSSNQKMADALWDRFFASLEANPAARFISASPGELLHDYITLQLRLGVEPGHTKSLHRYRLEIVGHHQRVLERSPDEHLERLDATAKWIELNLGPWPI